MSSIEGRVIKLNKPGELGYKKECLNVVGKIISDKEISFKTCKNALLGMWGNPQGVAVIDIGLKKMLFSFKDRKKGLQIMQNGPWNVRGNMVNLRLWREVNQCSRVSINITKALPTGFWLDREELPPLWVFFRYERLPDSYCFNCRILGHEKKTCKNPTAMASWDPTKKRYKPGLGADKERREEYEDKEAKKLRSSNTSRDSREYQPTTHDSEFLKEGQMAEEAGLNMPQPQP
ncbi:hypothetical protein Ahy_B03g068324 [Arachis hypogaea]|uniref:CCHC-type domain-containing protein n=1 Tax=Arachis hypogaea TaxID=3818 RepID=A0A445A9H9_ARAHY|nr:hypothetical protein Ahy_B03g068324 [Arachis hypogaea]